MFGVISQPTTYTYKTVEDLNITADVFIPTVTLYSKYPVVMTIHGGGTMEAFSTQEQEEILARGWMIVSIQFRLCPEALLQDMIEDIQDAYEWIRTVLVNTVPLNPDAIAVWGGSAGGGLTVISGFKLTPRPQAIIAFYPYATNYIKPYVYNSSNPVSEALVEGVNLFKKPIAKHVPMSVDDELMAKVLVLSVQEEKAGWLLTTKDPNEPIDNINAMLRNYSAVYNIDENYPPTYLIQGLNDKGVPYEQSVEMAAILNQKNVPYKLDLVPDVDHAFDRGNVSVEIWNDHILPVFDFMQKYLTNSSEIVEK